MALSYLIAALLAAAVAVFALQNSAQTSVRFLVWTLDGLPLAAVALASLGIGLVVAGLPLWIQSWRRHSRARSAETRVAMRGKGSRGAGSDARAAPVTARVAGIPAAHPLTGPGSRRRNSPVERRSEVDLELAPHELPAYSRLLLDVIEGDPTVSIRARMRPRNCGGSSSRSLRRADRVIFERKSRGCDD